MTPVANDQPKLYIEIIKQLNQIIRNDQLKSGDRLPSERELSERLQVGRSSVREAFRALELLELIETRRGEGTFIKKAGSHRLVEIILSFILNDESARQNLAETRKIVEVEALRLACQRITDEQLDTLNKLIEKSKSEWQHGDFPVEEDYLFHKTIVEACHNGLLLNLWIPLVEYNKVAIRESLAREGRPAASIAEHEKVYEALSRKCEQEAVVALEEHLKNSRF
ncbi:transcriptional regulator [Alkalihalophilus pseudofirmus]|nr:transcriptional regulator [Alkalihalophilus pseudofirmus]